MFLISVPGVPYRIKNVIEEFQREHIPGSLNNYYRNLVDPDTGAFLDPADLRERFSTLGVFEKDRVISYCGGGIASTVTSLALRLAGHQAVAVYDRSLPEWTADPNLPLEWGVMNFGFTLWRPGAPACGSRRRRGQIRCRSRLGVRDVVLVH